ncbi:MAG TPA: lipocalin family protein [Cyclobacteriaceae bacterium]
MNLKHLPFLLVLLASCTASVKQSTKSPLVGTWKLISGTIITPKDTTVTGYTKDKSFIKVINDTHFAFMLHDLNGGKDSTAVYASGGGKYELVGDKYTEHLEYCTDRQWEGHDFSFRITITNDTLMQQGIEEVASAGVSQVNIEKYVRASR